MSLKPWRPLWCLRDLTIVTLLCLEHQSNLNKLQRVQNAVARTVLATSKREDITSVLAELHRLPVTARIDFKIAVITFNLLTTEQPSYLRELVQLRQPSRSPIGQAITNY